MSDSATTVAWSSAERVQYCAHGHIILRTCGCDMIYPACARPHCCCCFIERCGGAGFPPTPQPRWNATHPGGQWRQTEP